MSGNAMRLKAKIRNFAKKKGMSAQVVLQNYMFERFLERLSKSEHKDKFILKGGLLVAALVGIETRSTMYMDVTVRNYPVNSAAMMKAIEDVCSIHIDDDVLFSLSGTEPIRNEDTYGGLRVSLISTYDTITTPMHIDITTGDAITPKEIRYAYDMIFYDGDIELWAYNVETVLAEKVETILRRGQLNTRPRDFYDVYILTNTQPFDRSVFQRALRTTSEHRGTTHILSNMQGRLDEIAQSPAMENRWVKYTNAYNYAKSISFKEVVTAVKELI